MTVIEIRVPIWNGRKVGLNIEKLRGAFIKGEKKIYVTVTYKDKFGVKPFPFLYSFDVDPEKIKSYPKDNVKGVTLVLIPITDLEIESATEEDVLKSETK